MCLSAVPWRSRRKARTHSWHWIVQASMCPIRSSRLVHFKPGELPTPRADGAHTASPRTIAALAAPLAAGLARSCPDAPSSPAPSPRG